MPPEGRLDRGVRAEALVLGDRHALFRTPELQSAHCEAFVRGPERSLPRVTRRDVSFTRRPALSRPPLASGPRHAGQAAELRLLPPRGPGRRDRTKDFPVYSGAGGGLVRRHSVSAVAQHRLHNWSRASNALATYEYCARRGYCCRAPAYRIMHVRTERTGPGRPAVAVAMNRCPILTASPPTISHFDSESGQWQGGRQQRGSYTRSLYQSPTRGGRSLAPIRRSMRAIWFLSYIVTPIFLDSECLVTWKPSPKVTNDSARRAIVYGGLLSAQAWLALRISTAR
ncbi:hypothetical protein VTO73DRAFT_4809 [Trametes versicolor]